jgi:rSAM/selenodomain-associated transferase 1
MAVEKPNHGDTDWIVVLAKQPLIGHAKTRLARDIGPANTRALAEAFVIDTLALVMGQSAARVLVALSPPEGRDWFARHAPGAELVLQPEDSFGKRILEATREAFVRGASRCVLIGIDTPHLAPQTLQEAFKALDSADVCIGPSVDGGYYLIGLVKDSPALFEDIPWSTPSVCELTLQRAKTAGLSVTELQTELDVDEGSDLEPFVQLLRERPTTAVNTRRVMAQITGSEI